MKRLGLLLAAGLCGLAALAAPAQAQSVGSLGTLTAGPYQSSATGTLTGPYQAGANLPCTIAYTNTSTAPQDSLCFTAQVLGNGYVQGLQGFFGKSQAVAQYTGQASFGLGDITLPGPGSYLVQVAGFAYDRPSQKWVNGPVRVYWLFPLAQPLPVELIRFAVAAAADTVTVAWETASERNCAYFEVQRSTNGSSWHPRKQVAGHGTSAAKHLYRYNEAQLLVRVYYRLRQVDVDGQEHFSPVVALAPKPVAVAVVAYPNPARDVAQLTAPAGVLVRFYDEAGRQRRQQTLDESGTLDVRGLPAGSYHLLVGEGASATRTRLAIF
ncbi:MAG: T9SS type A sorting domain-containing protein [Cytophagaceae bacterium]|nr:MAG: T9SS type A sorting domain-containing protein [Cytophagaceae bacterium]